MSTTILYIGNFSDLKSKFESKTASVYENLQKASTKLPLKHRDQKSQADSAADSNESSNQGNFFACNKSIRVMEYA